MLKFIKFILKHRVKVPIDVFHWRLSYPFLLQFQDILAQSFGSKNYDINIFLTFVLFFCNLGKGFDSST